MKTEVMRAVQELLERHWDTATIAKRLCLDTAVVQEIIKQLLT